MEEVSNRPILFLDIDGVLNCESFYIERHKENSKDTKKELRRRYKNGDVDSIQYYLDNLCSTRIIWLNDLCHELNMDVVISSSWRLGKTIEWMREILEAAGSTFNVIGYTDRLGYERGIEISKWLKDNIKPETHGVYVHDFYNYVILDDDSDMLLNQAPHFFQTDPYSGLTPNLCYKIKRFLTKETF